MTAPPQGLRFPLRSEPLPRHHIPGMHPSFQQLGLPLAPRGEQAFPQFHPDFSLLLARLIFSPSRLPAHPPSPRLGDGASRETPSSGQDHMLDLSGGRGLREAAQEPLGPGVGGGVDLNPPASSLCLALASVLLSRRLFISVGAVAINSMIKKSHFSESMR